jgi:hypothetical protein
MLWFNQLPSGINWIGHEDYKIITWSVLKSEYEMKVVYKIVQDRQCMCNVTLRRVRVTTVVMEKQQVVHILSMFV